MNVLHGTRWREEVSSWDLDPDKHVANEVSTSTTCYKSFSWHSISISILSSPRAFDIDLSCLPIPFKALSLKQFGLICLLALQWWTFGPHCFFGRDLLLTFIEVVGGTSFSFLVWGSRSNNFILFASFNGLLNLLLVISLGQDKLHTLSFSQSWCRFLGWTHSFIFFDRCCVNSLLYIPNWTCQFWDSNTFSNLWLEIVSTLAYTSTTSCSRNLILERALESSISTLPHCTFIPQNQRGRVENFAQSLSKES